MGAKPTLCGRKRNDGFRDRDRGMLPFVRPKWRIYSVPVAERMMSTLETSRSAVRRLGLDFDKVRADPTASGDMRGFQPHPEALTGL